MSFVQVYLNLFRHIDPNVLVEDSNVLLYALWCCTVGPQYLGSPSERQIEWPLYSLYLFVCLWVVFCKVLHTSKLVCATFILLCYIVLYIVITVYIVGQRGC